MGNLEKDIQVIQGDVEVVPKNDRYRGWFGGDPYGSWNSDNFEARNGNTNTITNFEKAFQVARQTFNTAPENYSDRTWYLDGLETRLGDIRAITHLDEAIRAAGKAIATQEDYLDRDKSAMVDLEAAIRFAREAVDTAPGDFPNQAALMNHLGGLLGKRFLRTRAMADLEEAIRLVQEAVNMITPFNPAYSLYNLAFQLSRGFSEIESIADGDKAIKFVREAIDATPETDSQRARMLENLALLLRNRYYHTGLYARDRTDLDEANRIEREASKESPVKHPDRACWLNHLGNLFRHRYLSTAAENDLEEAIRIIREAIDTTVKDHPKRPFWLNDLGTLFKDRYLRTGAIVDLEKAIRLVKEAIDIFAKEPDQEEGSPPEVLSSSLSSLLSLKSMRTGAKEDYKNAFLYLLEVQHSPNAKLDWASRLNHLGSLLSIKFLRTGAIVDLEEAIRITREAINATVKGDPGRVSRLSILGSQLGDRFLKTGAIVDLEEAIRVTREAVDLTPENDMTRVSCLNNLGSQLTDRFSRTAAIIDLESAIVYLKSALHQLNAPVIGRINAAKGIIRCGMFTSDWEQAYEASTLAIRLIPELRPRSLQNSDKVFMVSRVFGLASDAAAAAINAGKSPLVALQLLEQGRGVILDEMRADISDLLKRHPRLAEQFLVVQNQLETDKLIVKIRKRPGFEDFLLEPSEEKIRAAAKAGPIVVINVSKYRCDAILVTQYDIQSVALPYLNYKDAKERAQRGHIGDSEILEWLWDVVANPILDALGFTQCPLDEKWPHVWWIPTGPLSKFPLHAAGIHHDNSTETVLDRVMSSYSSSIKAIIHGRRYPVPKLSVRSKALLVAMNHTPGHTKLSFAAQEIEELNAICKSLRLDPIQPKRNKEAIMSHIPKCKIFHFAGHGQTDYIDPLQSYLLLEDWENDPLTAATLLGKASNPQGSMNVDHLNSSPYAFEPYQIDHGNLPFLAYLSACGTGQIRDQTFSDESIHLINVCQTSGFRHAIGTLWEVNDQVCVDMARITYEGMRDGGMTDESVCRGLHNASRELRDRWLNTPAGDKHGRRLRKVDTQPVKGVKSVKFASSLHDGDGDGRGDGLSRDIASCDDDEEPGLWVPYVHFGV
jgi:tetratricopeptide (TPR) repeat protein